MKKFLLLIFGLYAMLSYSQDNSDAEFLLNKVSENIKNYDNIYINYAYTLQNIEEDINQTNNDNTLAEIIKSGQIDESGNIKDHSIEPLMVYTRDLGSIYEFSSKTDDEKLIIKEENARFLTIKPSKYMLGFSDPTNTNKEDFKGKISPLKEIKIETF